MRFRFTLSHAVEGSIEVNEPDGWKDVALKLERHEEFHSLIEHFSGSFILYGNNGQVNGGIDFVLLCEKNHGVDTTIMVDIDVTFDNISFSNVFNGQYSIADLEQLPDNKMRIPIIRDDFWSKFIARLDTPVNIQSVLDLDGNTIDAMDKVSLNLSSQKIQKQYRGELETNVFFTQSEMNVGEYFQLDFDNEILDEIEEKFHIPVAVNPEIPVNIFTMLEAGSYAFDLRIEASAVDNITNDNYATAPYVTFFIQFGTGIPEPLDQTDHGVALDQSTVYSFVQNRDILAGEHVRIYGEIIGDISDANSPSTAQMAFRVLTALQINTPSGAGTEQNDLKATHLYVTGQTVTPATINEAFLVHDVGAAICDRIIGQQNTFYSELLGSRLTKAREYISEGCAWAYAAIKGLQLRQYSLTEKPFTQSFNQWWKGINPILNLSLSYETIQIPEEVDASPDINMIEDLATWDNAPGGTWDFALFSQPFNNINAGSDTGYTYGTFAAVALSIYHFDTVISVQTDFGETPDVIVRWAILDAAFNEIDTIDLNYLGAGIKSESFILVPPADGVYFGCKCFNNTPTATKSFQIMHAFSELASFIYHEETVIRVEKKEEQYDAAHGTSVDFSHMRLTRKYDNDRMFNKAEVGYTRWESENIASLDDPQTKKNYSSRFQKVGKPIQILSEWIAAGLAIENTRRTTKQKSADYKYDNETFIIALNPTEQAESPDISPDSLNFNPELNENFSGITNLLNADTRYNLRLTPGRNFLRWQNYLQGALQGYLGSFFKFASGEGNYDFTADLESSCLNESGALDEKGDIMVTTNYLHLPEIYEVEHPMEWDEYVRIRNARKKPIGISETDTDHVPMFIKSLEYKPAKGTCSFILLAREHLEFVVLADNTPMQECLSATTGESAICENSITDEFGNHLVDEHGECIVFVTEEQEPETEGIGFDFDFDATF